MQFKEPCTRKRELSYSKRASPCPRVPSYVRRAPTCILVARILRTLERMRYTKQPVADTDSVFASDSLPLGSTGSVPLQVGRTATVTAYPTHTFCDCQWCRVGRCINPLASPTTCRYSCFPSYRTLFYSPRCVASRCCVEGENPLAPAARARWRGCHVVPPLSLTPSH